MPATVSEDNFAAMWERENLGLESQREPSEEPNLSPGAAAAARRRELRARPRYELLPELPTEVVEETEEVNLAPTVGFTPPPMPQLTMPQGQASTGQAPPSTDQGAYAAAFPFDSVSEVIRSRQGIGSLG